MPAQQATLLKLASTGGEDFDQVLRRFLQTSVATMSCHRASYWEYDRVRSVIRCRLLYENGAGATHPRTELAVAGNEPYFSALERDSLLDVVDIDVAKPPRTASFPCTHETAGEVRSVLDVPIWSQEELKAVLCFETSGERREWSDEDKHFAVSAASIIAVRRLEDVRLQHERDAVKAARTLLDLSLGSYGSAEEWMERSFPAIAEALRVDQVGFWRLEEHSSVLRCERRYLAPTKSWDCGMSFQQQQARRYFQALQSSGVVAIADTQTDPRCADLDSELMRGASRAVIDVLVFVDGEKHGLIRCTMKDAPRRWTAEDQSFATSLANLLSLRFAEAQRRMAEQQLRVNDRLASLGTLASGVAHEINNPLGFIMGNLEFLRGELPPASTAESAAEMHAAIDDAMSGARRVRDIVADLKTLSRDTDESALKQLDLKELASVSVRMAQNALKHRATITLDISDGLTVLGYEARLGQVFLNLLMNAAQAMPDRPATDNRVELRARGSGDVIEVIVSDNGIGMTEDVCQRVFDPFFTTKAVGVGTGLGLSIVHGVVTALGGTISVASSVNRGTTFTLRLPRSPVDLKSQSLAATSAATANARRRILVVDDEPMSGIAIRRLLSEHHVDVLTDPREALRRFGSGERYDVVLCDLMMPVITGMDLYETVAKQFPELTSRFVFITGGAVTEAARTFIDRPQIQKLYKPFDVDDLRSLVLRTLAA